MTEATLTHTAARRVPADVERWIGMALVVAAAAAGAYLRIHLARHDDGIYWPDEIFNSLEPAHHLAFGYGILSWEYVQGARSWVLPAFLAAILKTSVALGLAQPHQYLMAVRLVLTAAALGTSLVIYRVAREGGTGVIPAAAGCVVFAALPQAVYFSHRALSEVFSTLPVLVGCLYLLRDPGTRRDRLLGGAFLGLAVLLRLHNVLFMAGFMTAAVVQRRPRAAAELAVVFGAGILALGLVDLVTWGGFLHSAISYTQFSLSPAAKQWGSSPPSYYLATAISTNGLLGLLLLALAAVGAMRARALGVVCLVFVLAHVAIAHKELRFLFPVLPLLCALSAVGLQVLRERAGIGALAVAMGVLIASSAFAASGIRNLSFAALGSYPGSPKTQVSGFDDGGPANRLFLVARQQPDLCGVKLESDHLAWSGGYTYLHRRVPIYGSEGPPRESGYFNYVVANNVARGDGVVVASDREFVLVRTGGSCRHDPAFRERL